MSYTELEAGSNRIAHLLRRRGLRRGDAIALLMRNHLGFMTIVWAAQRSGLFFTPISWRFKAEEIRYILEDSSAKAIFVTCAEADVGRDAADQLGVKLRFASDGQAPGFELLDSIVDTLPDKPIEDESAGRDMLYSSGTTGRPKGIVASLSDQSISTIPPAMAYLTQLYEFSQATVNLTPAPLYHAGPLRYSMCVAHMGGVNIIMPGFDAEALLQLIERYRATHVELVPAMFVRLLRLPQAMRERYDLSSLQFVIHGTGRCAPEVKREIIDWFGPIVHEQYGGSEGNGLCVIGPEEWLQRPGSVGKAAVGRLRIVGDDGGEVPAGEDGLVYFEGGPRFDYRNDPEKTRAGYSQQGWSTLGDIGHVDEDGYLYLTDRLSNMIISGGVNIYPQEAENILISHPEVLDAGVFGVPDAEFGETVIAAVHLVDPTLESAAVEQALIEHCRERLSSVKCPRRILFTTELPRHETGKIYKRLLVERYAAELSQ